MIVARVVGAMVAGAALRAALVPFVSATQLHADVHGVGSYLEVLGGMYSIVIAFVIYVVWDQFNRVQSGLGQEASALEDLARVSDCLSDRGTVTSVRGAVRRYMESTAGDEPRRLAAGQMSTLAEEHFSELCRTIRAVDLRTEKDAVLYEELLRGLTRVSDARDERLCVSATRVPPTLWNLVIFASWALLVGFLLLGIQSVVLSAAVVAAVAGCMTFLLSVIRDMDNPFTGAWNVSYQTMSSIAARIGLR